MTQGTRVDTKAPMFEGQTITCDADGELVILFCNRPGNAYTVTVETPGAITGYTQHITTEDHFENETDARYWATNLVLMKRALATILDSAIEF